MMTASQITEVAEAIARCAEATYINARPELLALCEMLEEMGRSRVMEAESFDFQASADYMLLSKLGESIDIANKAITAARKEG